MNLGRIYLAQELFSRARSSFERALQIAPDYTLAREALGALKKRVM